MAKLDQRSIIHPFEYIGAHKLYTEERFLLADEMGLFKTAQAIFANSKFREKKKNLRTLIVSPTSVREHWARELNKWAYPKGEINLVYSHDLEQKVKDAKEYTWTIVSYPLLSSLENGLLQQLKNIGFHHIIADEVHNAKNPDALRTRALKTLSDQADYVSLLSGTPIPNTMSDLYVLMSILDPEKYPFDPEKDSSASDNFRIARQSFIQLYLERPQAVKELLHRKMLRRMANNYLSSQIPQAEYHRIKVPLNGKHLAAYQQILEQEMNVGKKIMELAKVSLDPCLIDDNIPRYKRNGKDISCKYDVLDEIIERETRKKNGKVLVFTDLKTGIIDYLVEGYKDFGAIAITGDDSTENGVREKLRQQFQRDPKTKVLLATTTMNEGVDLTAATAVVDLTIPYTPAERHQRWRRSHRTGEVKKDKVDIYTLYNIIPGDQPSLDQALLDMVDTKEKIVSYLLKGIQVSLEELKAYDKTEKIPRIVNAITYPSKAIFNYFIKWRGIGSENAQIIMQKSPEMSKYIAELYPNFSMARNSAEVYIPIIKELERIKGKRLENKVDICCGPGMLGYFLDEPTIGVDINSDMVIQGRKLYPKNYLCAGSMSDLPIKDKSSDLTLCSLAFQMSGPNKERSMALKEMSRILTHHGYSIITVPGKYMGLNDERKFEDVAGKYGFKIKDHQKLVGKSRIDVYVLQKKHMPISERIYSLKWIGDPGRKKKK